MDAKIIGETCEIEGRLSNGNIFTPKMPMLGDSGARFSAIRASILNQLKAQNFPFVVIKTKRPTPSSASNHAMTIIGDVILDVELKGPDGKLRISNVRFTIFNQLSCSIIIGQEVLASLDFVLSGSNISLGGYTFPLLNPKTIIELDVVDAVTVTNEETPVTIITVRGTVDPLLIKSDKKYLLNPILINDFEFSELNGTKPVLAPLGLGLSNLTPFMALGTELKSIQGHIFTSELYELPPKFTCTLEEVSKEIERKESDNVMINSLQDRDQLIDDSVIDELVKNSDFNEEYKDKFYKLLSEFRFAFSVDDVDVGQYEGEEIKIELTENTPVYVRPRRLAYSLREYVDETIVDMEKNGIIERSTGSGWNSPIHMVKKKNGKYRMTIDYREVNKKIRPNRFPIPRCREMFDKLTRSKYFAAFDLRAGYWNIRIAEPYRDLTTFTVKDRQYRWISMPMGLKISGNIFQRIMNEIIGDDLNKGMSIYLDDVICYAVTQGQLLQLMRKVLHKFSKAGILLNPAKCNLGKKELDYLGFTISENGFRPQLNKTQAIRNYPKPNDKKALKRFLGMCQFYSETVPNLQLNMGPLHRITGSTKDYIWDAEMDSAFNKVKELLANSVTLAYPRLGEKDRLILTTDACDKGFGCVLSEINENAIERPLGFTSGCFRGAQERWKILEKECYALIQGLEYFYVYLYGRKFTCRTDNYSLSFLKSSTFTKRNNSPNWKTIRWIEFIQTFDFDVEHFKGSKEEMFPADALSRAVGTTISTLTSLDKTIIKKPFWVKNNICLADLSQSQQNDKHRILAKYGPYRNIRSKTLSIEGLLYVKGRGSKVDKLIIPVSLEREYFDFMHFPNHTSAKTMEDKIIKGNLFVPECRKKTRKYVARCETCVSIKPKKNETTSPTVTTTGNHPWSIL